MNKKRAFFSVLCLTIGLLFLAAPAATQAQPERSQEGELLDALRDFFKRDYLSVGVLLQTQGEFHWAPARQGENTFRIPTARLKVNGELDDSFGYVLQADMARIPSLLDAQVSYRFSDKLALTTGAMKPGISAEYLTPASGTDFINRSRIVSILVQNRDIGVLLETEPLEGLQLSGGVFNGTNQNLENNDNTFYWTGRMEGSTDFGAGNSYAIAINGGYSRENVTRIGNGRLPAIAGDRIVYGADTRLEIKRWMLSGEVLAAEVDYVTGLSDTVFGFHVTGGFRATDNLQLVLRYDHLESEHIPFAPDLALGGINYNFTEAASFQLNYEVNPNSAEFENHHLLAQMQIAF